MLKLGGLRAKLLHVKNGAKWAAENPRRQAHKWAVEVGRTPQRLGRIVEKVKNRVKSAVGS